MLIWLLVNLHLNFLKIHPGKLYSIVLFLILHQKSSIIIYVSQRFNLVQYWYYESLLILFFTLHWYALKICPKHEIHMVNIVFIPIQILLYREAVPKSSIYVTYHVSSISFLTWSICRGTIEIHLCKWVMWYSFNCLENDKTLIVSHLSWLQYKNKLTI